MLRMFLEGCLCESVSWRGPPRHGVDAAFRPHFVSVSIRSAIAMAGEKCSDRAGHLIPRYHNKLQQKNLPHQVTHSIPRNGQVDSVKLFIATVHSHAFTLRLHEEVLVNGAWASLGQVKPWFLPIDIYRRVGAFIFWMMLDDGTICALQFSVCIGPLFIWCLHLGLRSLCSKRASSSQKPQRQSNRVKLQYPRLKTN